MFCHGLDGFKPHRVADEKSDALPYRDAILIVRRCQPANLDGDLHRCITPVGLNQKLRAGLQILVGQIVYDPVHPAYVSITAEGSVSEPFSSSLTVSAGMDSGFSDAEDFIILACKSLRR